MYYDEDLQTWIVTGYDEAKAVLEDPAVSSQWLSLSGLNPSGSAALLVRDWLIWMDEPGHQHHRSRLNPLFTGRAIKDRSGGVRGVIARWYAGFVERGGGEAVAELIVPMTTELIGDVLGTGSELGGLLQEWSDRAGSLMAMPHRPRVAAQVDETLERLGTAMESCPYAPKPGTVLSRAGDNPLPLVSLFAFAGFATTSQALARLMDLYLDDALDPAAAVAELVAWVLRLDTPVPQVPRVVAWPVEIAGHRLEPGQRVLVMLAAADRDPRVFADVRAGDMAAGDRRHLAYGHARHRCLGAPLANLVLGEFLTQLRESSRPYRICPAQWHWDRGYRNITRLDVHYGEAGHAAP